MINQVKAVLKGRHTCLEPDPGVGVLPPLPPACDVRGVACGMFVSVLGEAFSALRLSAWDALDDLEDLDVDCEGIVEGRGVEVLNSGTAAGLGFARLREPMAQIDLDNMRELQEDRLFVVDAIAS